VAERQAIQVPVVAVADPPALKSVDKGARDLFAHLRRVNRPIGVVDMARLFKEMTKLQMTKSLQSL
jgi:hypothetical protein